jgi:hypothetical protein
MNSAAKNVSDALAPMLKSAGVAFVTQSQKDFEGVTESELSLIWDHSVNAVIATPNIPENPTPQEAAIIAEIRNKNAKALEVISQIEVQSAEKLRLIRERALTLAKAISVSVISTGVMLAAKNGAVTPQ